MEIVNYSCVKMSHFYIKKADQPQRVSSFLSPTAPTPLLFVNVTMPGWSFALKWTSFPAEGQKQKKNTNKCKLEIKLGWKKYIQPGHLSFLTPILLLRKKKKINYKNAPGRHVGDVNRIIRLSDLHKEKNRYFPQKLTFDKCPIWQCYEKLLGFHFFSRICSTNNIYTKVDALSKEEPSFTIHEMMEGYGAAVRYCVGALISFGTGNTQICEGSRGGSDLYWTVEGWGGGGCIFQSASFAQIPKVRLTVLPAVQNQTMVSWAAEGLFFIFHFSFIILHQILNDWKVVT